MPHRSNKWISQIKGNPNSKSWEISVVRENNDHGRASWGWFGADKILISHNGGPCDWPLGKGLGPLMVVLAEKYAEYLNKLEAGQVEDTERGFLLDFKTD